MHGQKIYIPKKHRNKVLEVPHEGHLRFHKIKVIASSYVN